MGHMRPRFEKTEELRWNEVHSLYISCFSARHFGGRERKKSIWLKLFCMICPEVCFQVLIRKEISPFPVNAAAFSSHLKTSALRPEEKSSGLVCREDVAGSRWVVLKLTERKEKRKGRGWVGNCFGGRGKSHCFIQ